MKRTGAFFGVGAALFCLTALFALTQGAPRAALLLLLGGALLAPLPALGRLRARLKLGRALCVLLALALLFTSLFVLLPSEAPAPTSPEAQSTPSEDGQGAPSSESVTLDPADLPAYCGRPYVTVGDNVPVFSEEELSRTGYESYLPLDELGRTVGAVACVGQDTMPADGEERGSISKIKPSGWVQARYDCVNGGYLYNRCHLIGWQLSAENANERNLITGTKYLNVEGMLPFENLVADYIKETDNHVAYRITPIYQGDDLLASGVQMEAYSVEDAGEGVCFNVYCYNVQPGVTLDYTNGTSALARG